MSTTYIPKQYELTTHRQYGHQPMLWTTYELTADFASPKYDDDRAAISKLEVGETHFDADGDAWVRVS